MRADFTGLRQYPQMMVLETSIGYHEAFRNFISDYYSVGDSNDDLNMNARHPSAVNSLNHAPRVSPLIKKDEFLIRNP